MNSDGRIDNIDTFSIKTDVGIREHDGYIVETDVGNVDPAVGITVRATYAIIVGAHPRSLQAGMTECGKGRRPGEGQRSVGRGSSLDLLEDRVPAGPEGVVGDVGLEAEAQVRLDRRDAVVVG